MKTDHYTIIPTILSLLLLLLVCMSVCVCGGAYIQTGSLSMQIGMYAVCMFVCINVVMNAASLKYKRLFTNMHTNSDGFRLGL